MDHKDLEIFIPLRFEFITQEVSFTHFEKNERVLEQSQNV
jgi:hypothetical protein